MVYWNRFVKPRKTQRRKQHRAVIVGAQANKETESRHAQHYSQLVEKTFGRMDNSETKNNWGQFAEIEQFIAGTENGSDDVALQCCMATLES